MVLTAEEIHLAERSVDGYVRSALRARRTTDNFCEQCCSDREIQRYLKRKGTAAFKFNCVVIHQSWKFVQVSALTDHGWEEHGPTSEKLFAIYRTLPIYSPPSNMGAPDEFINNLNKDANSKALATRPLKNLQNKNENNVIVYDDTKDEPGFFWRLFTCVCG